MGIEDNSKFSIHYSLKDQEAEEEDKDQEAEEEGNSEVSSEEEREIEEDKS